MHQNGKLPIIYPRDMDAKFIPIEKPPEEPKKEASPKPAANRPVPGIR